MRKNWLVWIAALSLMLVLSACSDDDEAAPEDVKEKDNQTEEKEQKEPESSEEEEEVETSVEKQESDDDDDSEESEESDSDEESNDDETSDSEDEEFSYDTIIDFGFEIFEAQAEEDYDFLESAVSEGSSVNKEDNTFQFDNVTHPHEYEFITEKDYQFLSERYVNGSEEEGVTIGYEVTDFETESSYVIDTEFIKEDGEWKIKDIDVNK